MKVLFVGKANSVKTDGGSHTFIRNLLSGFKESVSFHDFFYVEPNPKLSPIKSIVKSKKIDLVWYLTPYYEETDAPFVITVWDLAHRYLQFFPEFTLTGWTFEQREQFYRYVLPRATFIVTGNSFGAKQIQEYYNIPINVIKIIPLPTDPIVDFVANTGVIDKYNIRSQNYLFYPAQFWPHKNHISVIDAFCVAKEEFTGFKLVLTGSDKGNLEFIKSYVKELNLSSEVLFLGFVEKDEVNQLYANAFAHIYGSCLGPDNIPPLEAMALDCPTVCANFDGAREQLGDAVLYFDPLDFVQAAKAVKDLKDPELRRLIKVKGRDLIKNLSGVEYCKKINNIINDFVPWRRLWSSGNEYRHL